MTREFINVEFKVYGLPYSKRDTLNDLCGLRLGILGSNPELGSWKPRNMLPAELCEAEDNVWSVTAQLPISATFKWTWVVITRDAHVLYVDPAGPKLTILNHFSGIMETTWGLTEACFKPNISLVKMRVHYHCQQDEVLAIVGSGACLGSWDAKKATRAKQSPVNSNNWITQALLDTIDGYEWKWVVLDSVSGDVKKWEEGENRRLDTTCNRQQMMDTEWNSGTVAYHHGVPSTTFSEVDMVSQEQTNMTNQDVVYTDANALEFPLELTQNEVARTETAARKTEPRWRKYARRLPALLPFMFNWCRL